jgi:hypothetical protein
MSDALAITSTTICDELLGAATIAEICNVGRSAVYERLAKVPCEVDVKGVRRWRLSALPADYRQRIELAKQIKGYARAEDIVDWKKRAEALFHWRLCDLTRHEERLWPHRKEAILEYYRCVQNGLPRGRAEQRACEVWNQLTRDAAHPNGLNATPRTVRNWIEPVERCGGPEHAPDVAYTQHGKRKKKGEHVPQATVDYFCELLLENQRKFKPAYRKLMKQLAMWRETSSDDFAIPGFSAPPPNAKGKDHPHRWTYRYLAAPLRRPRPTLIAAARHGSMAAAELRACVLRTRAEAKVGEYYVLDDQEYDQKVNLPGLNPKAMRPLGLDAMDYASACVFTSFFKPTLWEQEERVKKMLREYDAVWFVVHILQTTGIRRDGTWFIAEHGTAAIPGWLEKNLAKVFGEIAPGQPRVGVWRGGIGGDPAFAGVFGGARRGNPQFKAVLESARNRLRNDMADQRLMRGQVGMNRDHQPEELVGRDRYNEVCLKAWKRLTEDSRELLALPFMAWHEWGELTSGYIQDINLDQEHELEGWEERVVPQWRLESDPVGKWRDRAEFADLSPFDQLMVSNALKANPHLTRVRRRSRWEEFLLGAQGLLKLDDWDLPRLLENSEGKDFGKIRTVDQGGFFIFQDSDADPYGRDFTFLARAFDAAGHEVLLTPGAKYLTYLNPVAPDRLIVCRENGGYIGTCRAITRARIGNAAEEAKLIALERKLAGQDKTDLQRIGAERIREHHEMITQNAGVAAAARKSDARAQQQKAAVDEAASEFFS